jgi:hypothetical protein
MTEDVRRKNQYLKLLNSAYQIFIDTVKSIPAVEQMAQTGCTFFDTGIFWMEKGILFKQNEPQVFVQDAKEPNLPPDAA